MTDQHRQSATTEQFTPQQERCKSPGQISSPGAAATMVFNDSVLAISAIADMARLVDPPVSARRQGRAGRRAKASSRIASGICHDNPVEVLRCRIIWRLVAELYSMASERDLPEGAARRRPRCHIRQVAMYLSHVVLSVPYRTVAAAFGRDRTTVVHACAVVEDRRDDQGYDRFVERCERCIEAVFAPFGFDHAEL